jgi:hypothetical protein
LDDDGIVWAFDQGHDQWTQVGRKSALRLASLAQGVLPVSRPLKVVRAATADYEETFGGA